MKMMNDGASGELRDSLVPAYTKAHQIFKPDRSKRRQRKYKPIKSNFPADSLPPSVFTRRNLLRNTKRKST